jgi:hypothetical protein
VTAVVFRVRLRGLGGVMVRVVIVSRRDMGVMPGLVVIAHFMVLRGFAMVVRRVIVVLRGFVMVLGG